jgi:hypothetical protein
VLSWTREQQFQFTSIWELVRLIFPILFQVCTSETFHLLWSTLAKVTNYCASRYQSPLLQISAASADKSKLQDECSLSMEYTWSNCISQLLNTLDGGIQQQFGYSSTSWGCMAPHQAIESLEPSLEGSKIMNIPDSFWHQRHQMSLILWMCHVTCCCRLWFSFLIRAAPGAVDCFTDPLHYTLIM